MARLDDVFSRERRKAIVDTNRKVRTADERKWTLLPDPPRRERYFTIFSVDDHICEPPGMFDGRVEKRFQDRAPRVVEMEDGGQGWLFEGSVSTNIGLSTVVGRPLEECAVDPERFEYMRQGAFDADARVRDMDLDGVYAQVCFPQGIIGFGGQKLQLRVEPEFALALVRAINCWHREEWAGRHPERLVPVQIPYLHDPEVAANEVRKNAEKGFKALSFPESPQKLGLPSIHTDYWDPVMRACEETETVICLHVGSSSEIPGVTDGAPMETPAVLFGSVALFTAVDWLFSLIPVRFPRIRITTAEGGINWVPGLIDRLQHMKRYQDIYSTWRGVAETPIEVLRRNFWHCNVDDPTTMRLRDVIGVDRIMIESDYPHLDSPWPNTQELFKHNFEGVEPEAVRLMSWQNASELFRHRVPAAVSADPNAY